MVALPFCHLELRTARPKSERYPKEVNTLGDYIRARRTDLNLLQSQVAELVSVHLLTIINWEGNESILAVRYLPAIIRFLGYDPLPPVAEFPELLARTRRMLGLSQRKMAERIGVDPATIEDWGAGRHRPTGKSVDLIGKVLSVAQR